MAKPWAKYEINWINHPKFLALSGNAIALWAEGKNYTDSHFTDGLLPLAIVKRFKFYSVHNVTMLTRSIGPKTPGQDAEQYEPLWEAHVVGFKMHEYLEHNDCRDEVIQRSFERQVVAQKRAEAQAVRAKAWREARAATKAAAKVQTTLIAAAQGAVDRVQAGADQSPQSPPDDVSEANGTHMGGVSETNGKQMGGTSEANETPLLRNPCQPRNRAIRETAPVLAKIQESGPILNSNNRSTVSIASPHQQQQQQQQQQIPPKEQEGSDARSKRPIFDGQRLTVFEWMLTDCRKTLGAYTDDFGLDEWFWELDARAVRTHLVIPKRDGGAWLQSQLLLEAQRRGLPLQLASAPALGKQTTKLATALANIKREAQG